MDLWHLRADGDARIARTVADRAVQMLPARHQRPVFVRAFLPCPGLQTAIHETVLAEVILEVALSQLAGLHWNGAMDGTLYFCSFLVQKLPKLVCVHVFFMFYLEIADFFVPLQSRIP